MKTIAYLADAPIPSTAANAVQVLKMSAALGDLGFDVTLYAPWHAARVRDDAARQRMRRDFALGGAFRLRYLPYVALRQRLAGSYFPIAALAATLTRADLVYTRNARIATACARLGRPVILETHQAIGVSPRGLAAARAIALSPQLRRWVFISARLRELYRGAVALPDARCAVEHDAVDLDRFTPPLAAAEARRRLGRDPARPLVVYCGSLYPGRGAELLVDCAAALPHVDVRFVGGQPADVARLHGEVAARGLANLTLTGHVPLAEVATHLFAADVLVMPHTTRTIISDRRTATADYASPMKLFEYMAAGRAIVATRFPSVSEVLRDGDSAVLVDPDDAAALRAAIAALVADPARAARLGARARADVESYTWPRRAARIVDGIV